jgi:hypothetical protein
MQNDWTRRQVLRRGGFTVAGAAGLGLAGLAGYSWPRSRSPQGARPATRDTRGRR